MRVIDLSFPIGPHFRWTVASERRSTHEAGQNFQSTVLTVSCHAYTHVDAPVHFLPGDRDIASMPVDQWMGEAAVVDLTHLGENAEVTAADLDRRAGHVRAGDIVLLRTDWTDKMYGRWPDYFTQSPYCPPETAEWLVAKGPKNIGFDFFEEYCARLPEFTSEDFAMHRVILGAGVVIMEGLTNLAALPARRVDFAAPFYKIAGTEGAPARFFAIVD